MNDFEKGLVALTQSAINGIGTLDIPIQTESGVLTLGVDPKVNLSKVDFESFNIGQIDISDTHIKIGWNGKLPDNVSLNFCIDSQIGSWARQDVDDKTVISLDMSQTTIGDNVSASIRIDNTILDIKSPSGTNDFSATFTLTAKL